MGALATRRRRRRSASIDRPPRCGPTCGCPSNDRTNVPSCRPTRNDADVRQDGGMTPAEIDALADRFFAAIAAGDVGGRARRATTRRSRSGTTTTRRAGARRQPRRARLARPPRRRPPLRRDPPRRRRRRASSSSTCCGAPPTGRSRSRCRPWCGCSWSDGRHHPHRGVPRHRPGGRAAGAPGRSYTSRPAAPAAAA